MTNDYEIQWTHLKEVLKNYGEYFVNQLQMKMLRNNSNASGTLTNSFKYSYGIDEDKYWVEVEMEDYWKYVNEGRKAGKMPPVIKIEEWIKVKPVHPRPMSEEQAVRSLAWAVRKSIKKKKGFAPPLNALEEWIKKKQIPVNRMPSVRSLAWAISKKIGRFGTKGTHFYDEVLDDAKKYFERSISNAIQEDIKDWLENVVGDYLINDLII